MAIELGSGSPANLKAPTMVARLQFSGAATAGGIAASKRAIQVPFSSRIWVANPPEKGATLRVRWPLASWPKTDGRGLSRWPHQVCQSLLQMVARLISTRTSPKSGLGSGALSKATFRCSSRIARLPWVTFIFLDKKTKA